jgi:uncharacterized membrane protein
MFKEKTTWVGIFTGVIVLALTACVFLKILTGTEYAAALAGVGATATTLIGIMVNDRQKKDQ